MLKCLRCEAGKHKDIVKNINIIIRTTHGCKYGQSTPLSISLCKKCTDELLSMIWKFLGDRKGDGKYGGS